MSIQSEIRTQELKRIAELDHEISLLNNLGAAIDAYLTHLSDTDQEWPEELQTAESSLSAKIADLTQEKDDLVAKHRKELSEHDNGIYDALRADNARGV